MNQQQILLPNQILASLGILQEEIDSVTVNRIARKDTTYYLLWILEEILVDNQGCKLDEILLGKNLQYILIIILL